MDAVQRAELVSSVENFLASYHTAFQSGTREELEGYVHLPVLYITEDEVQLRDRYPFDPQKLRTIGEFHHAETETTVIHVDEQKAHVLIEGTRHREDDSIIETIESVYILQNRGAGWRVAAFSGIRGPI